MSSVSLRLLSLTSLSAQLFLQFYASVHTLVWAEHDLSFQFFSICDESPILNTCLLKEAISFVLSFVDKVHVVNLEHGCIQNVRGLTDKILVLSPYLFLGWDLGSRIQNPCRTIMWGSLWLTSITRGMHNIRWGEPELDC